ncbi:hypothetical protein ACFPOG_12695 [Paenibacillus aestuarii]|uniref:Uncharacterized protein n=1 Tax=Paenibacillus aestuarii TaxID=516965 RepID=A0ABW0K8L7_9BACL
MSIDSFGSIIKSIMNNRCTFNDNKHGFTAFNTHNVKWSQIDLNEGKVRIVLDFPENKYDEAEICQRIDIPPKSSGNKEAWLFVKTARQYNASHDAVEITIKNGYLKRYLESNGQDLWDFIEELTALSHFKLEPSYGRKIK